MNKIELSCLSLSLFWMIKLLTMAFELFQKCQGQLRGWLRFKLKVCKINGLSVDKLFAMLTFKCWPSATEEEPLNDAIASRLGSWYFLHSRVHAFNIFFLNFYSKITFQRKGRNDNDINDRVCVCGGGVQLKGNKVFMRNSEKCRQTSALSCVQCYLWAMHAVYLSLYLKNCWIRGPPFGHHCLFDCGNH